MNSTPRRSPAGPRPSARPRRSTTEATHGAAAPTPTGAAAPTLPSAGAFAPTVSTGPHSGNGSPSIGTNGTVGAQRIAAAFARARADGRAALIPYVVAGYPDHGTSLAAAIAAADAGADLLEIGLPYSDPLADGATLQRATSAALRAGAALDGSVALLREVSAARPNLPLVPMCYANQVMGGGDGRAVATRLAEAGASGVIVADLTPDEGLRFEAVAREVGLAVVYRSPQRRLRPAAWRWLGVRRIPLLRFAGGCDRRPNVAAAFSSRPRRRCARGFAGTGGCRFRREHSRPRPDAGGSRRRRRDRGLGTGRRDGPRWQGHRGLGPTSRGVAGRHRSLKGWRRVQSPTTHRRPKDRSRMSVAGPCERRKTRVAKQRIVRHPAAARPADRATADKHRPPSRASSVTRPPHDRRAARPPTSACPHGRWQTPACTAAGRRRPPPILRITDGGGVMGRGG